MDWKVLGKVMRHFPQRGGACACNGLLTRSDRSGATTLARASSSKPRSISAAPFRDRVVHHALTQILEPVFERRFTDHSYACRT